MIARLRALAHRRGSTRSLGLLRILFVFLLWSRWATELLFFHHAHEPWRAALSAAFFLSTSLLLIGFKTRFASIAVAAVLWWMYAGWAFFWGEHGWAHHHTYLLVAAGTWLALTPSGRSFSLDRWLEVRRARAEGRPPAPEEGWLFGLTLIALQLSAVYLFSAYNKTNAFFLSGDHLVAIFQHYYTGSDPITLPGFPLLCQVLAWLTVALEYVWPFALFHRGARRWLLPLGVLFHGILYIMLPVGTFTASMWVLYLAYFEPDEVDAVLDTLTTR